MLSSGALMNNLAGGEKVTIAYHYYITFLYFLIRDRGSIHCFGFAAKRHILQQVSE